MLKKALEGPLDCNEIKPVNPKGNQPWISIGRLDTEAPILWPPDVKSWLIGKDPDAGKDWGQEEKGMTEDEMVGWHHWFRGHEFEKTVGDSEVQGSLTCCSPWGSKESHTTEQLNYSNNKNPESPKACFSFAWLFWGISMVSHKKNSCITKVSIFCRNNIFFP